MAVLLFLWMVAPWQQVNAQASLEQNQRHQLSIASISSMDFYKPDHSSQFQVKYCSYRKNKSEYFKNNN